MDDFITIGVSILLVFQIATTTFVVRQAAEFEIFGYEEGLSKRLMDPGDIGLWKRHHWWVKQKISEHAARVYLAGGVAWLLTLWGFKWCILIWFGRIA